MSAQNLDARERNASMGGILSWGFRDLGIILTRIMHEHV